MNLLRALVTVSGMTLLSRILGFVRDFVIARTFGAGVLTDAFFVAFKLPNLLRRLFAEGAFSQAFVPILGEYRNQQGEERTRTLINDTASILSFVLLLVTLLGVVCAPWLVWLSAPGFAADGDKFAMTVTLTRITFPYILFMSLVAMAAGILNTWSRFALPAFTPVLLNLSFIGMALFAAPWFDPPILALGWAVFIGGLLQLALQLPALARIGMLPRISLNLRQAWQDEGVRRILKLMAPATLGVSVSQVSLLLNTIFASFLVSGSVSWLYYADRLMEFPSGMLGAALGTILLPSLSRYHASANTEDYARLLDWGLRLTLLLALPAALGLALLAVPLITTLFHHGAFTALDVEQTRRALVAYSLGLGGMILVKVLAPGFYARQNIKTPVKIALISLASTQGMNLLFVFGLQLEHAGLALSIGLAACLNALLLYRGLRRHGIYSPQPGWGKFLLNLLLALAVLSALLWLLMGREADWFAYDTLERITQLTRLVVAGAGVYFATLWVCGFRLRDFKRQSATQELEEPMKLSSNSFTDSSRIPGEFAFCIPDPSHHVCLGRNLNPHLSWTDVPPGTRSFVLICHDPDAPSKGDDVNQEGRSVPADLPRVDFFHWILVDIPASLGEIAAGEFSSAVSPKGKPGPQAVHGTRQGINDYTGWFAGDNDMRGDYYGYDGPCPPWNDSIAHRYVFTLYALDLERLPLEGRLTGPEVRQAIASHVLGQASLTGTYSLNPALA